MKYVKKAGPYLIGAAIAAALFAYVPSTRVALTYFPGSK